jgi:small neutral amino acid transporter SnatA (MarC family)
VVAILLAMDWIAMIYVDAILKWLGAPLQVFAVVLGVTQIALGLQLILRSLVIIGVFAERAG